VTAAFGDLALFDLVVVENGAVLHDPAARATAVLGEPPSAAFVTELARRGVAHLAVGQVIVAMRASFAPTVLGVIRDRGLPLQVVFNREALMVLPTGVHKGSGLAAALSRLKVAPPHAVAIGDAENDHAMLALCGYGSAVANALPALKQERNSSRAASGGRGSRARGTPESPSTFPRLHPRRRLPAFHLPTTGRLQPERWRPNGYRHLR
jgi:hydroxymethylpyrimidine pyrophosphatase-like HAD family hydrolase